MAGLKRKRNVRRIKINIIIKRATTKSNRQDHFRSLIATKNP